MSYSDLYLQRNSHVPAVLSVAVLIGVIASIFFIARSVRPSTSQASQIPVQSATVANLSQSSATIYWQTQEPNSGWILYGENENSLTNVARDLRDIGEKRGLYMHHAVQLSNLKPLTKYFYQIVIDNKIVSIKGEKVFTLSTTNKIDVINQYDPMYGKVMYANGKAAESALVIVTGANLYPLITITKITGEWLLPVHQAVDSQTNTQKSFTENDVLSINILDEKKNKTSVQTILKNASPLPQTLVMGNSYTFTKNNNVLGTQSVVVEEEEDISNFEVLYPQDRAVISAGKPLIRGTGSVNQKIGVTVNRQKTSLNYSYVATVDKKGSWSVDITTPLTPGEYTMKATVNGLSDSTIARNFTITKVGQQVLGETTATPSATLAPTISVAPTLTLIPTVATIAPTVAYATNTPVPTIIRTGNNYITVAGASAALLVIGLGVLFLH